MRIAVASQNFRTVTSHAGKTRRFLVFEVEAGKPAVEVGRLDLPKEMSVHAFNGEGRHPLEEMDGLIAGSMGPGFIRRMAAWHVQAAATEVEDPAEAARALAEGRLPPALPGDLRPGLSGSGGGCSCG